MLCFIANRNCLSSNVPSIPRFYERWYWAILGLSLLSWPAPSASYAFIVGTHRFFHWSMLMWMFASSETENWRHFLMNTLTFTATNLNINPYSSEMTELSIQPELCWRDIQLSQLWLHGCTELEFIDWGTLIPVLSSAIPKGCLDYRLHELFVYCWGNLFFTKYHVNEVMLTLAANHT